MVFLYCEITLEKFTLNYFSYLINQYPLRHIAVAV